MTDAFVIMKATRLGYEIISDQNNDAWYRKKEDRKLIGPFKTLEDASYAAIGEYETQLAFSFIDKHGVQI